MRRLSVPVSRDKEVITGFAIERPFPEVPNIMHCGEALCSRQHRVPWHEHAGIELMYLMHGTVTWELTDTIVRQGAGELFIAGARQRHRTAPGSHPEFKAFYLGLDLEKLGEEGRRLAERLKSRTAWLLPDAQAMEGVMRGVFQHALDTSSGWRVPQGFAHLLLMQIEERLENGLDADGTVPRPQRRVYTEPVQKVIYHLERTLTRRVPLTELGRIAHQGSSNLATTFKAEVGMSPAAYHRRLRLDAAKDALRNPESSIANVAQEFGFSSSQHLSVLFRAAYKTTPCQWMRGGHEPEGIRTN